MDQDIKPTPRAARIRSMSAKWNDDWRNAEFAWNEAASSAAILLSVILEQAPSRDVALRATNNVFASIANNLKKHEFRDD
jgi:hypothetical protein